MKKIDPHSLYRLGQTLAKLSTVEWWDANGAASTVGYALNVYMRANVELEQFLKSNPFNLRMTSRSGDVLSQQLTASIKLCIAEEDKDKKVPYETAGPVETKLREFETLLRAEAADLNVYLVEQKQALDTSTIVFSGETAFSRGLSDLGDHVLQDARSAMRCIAFELPTAAAFHLHRINEAVLGIYWDTVVSADRPKNPTLGTYISELRKRTDHDPLIVSVLDQIRALHRNPTMHADYTLLDVEEAISLFGIVSSAIRYMLQEIEKCRLPIQESGPSPQVDLLQALLKPATKD